jgi:hypothetical protein
MAFYLNPETISMFLLGVGLVSLSRLGRLFLNKYDPNKTPLSDNVKKLRLKDGLKLKIESLQKKGEKLISESKKILSAKETTDNIN